MGGWLTAPGRLPARPASHIFTYLPSLPALQPNTSAYLLLLALVPSAAALLAALVTNHVPFVQQSELEEGQHVATTGGCGEVVVVCACVGSGPSIARILASTRVQQL